MKTPLRVAAVFAAAALAGTASAQQQPDHVRVGLGVGLPTSELSSLFSTATVGTAGLLPAQIYVPIDFTRHFRLEPEVGIIARSQDGGNDAAYYTFGAGAFYVSPLAQSAHLYAGGRVVLGLERSTTNAGGGFDTKTKGTDVYVAAAFGGEVLPHPRIGIGAEAQLGGWAIGDRKSTTAGVTTTERGGSSVQTQGVIFVRLYFN